MPVLKRLVQAHAGLFFLGTGFIAYSYPDLRREPMQLVHAIHRGIRCATTGIMMAYDYMSVKEINTEAH